MSTEPDPDSAAKPTPVTEERALPPSPSAPPPPPPADDRETAWRDIPPSPPRGGRLALLLALLALVALAALAYAGWLGWQRIDAAEARAVAAAGAQSGMEDELSLLARRLEEQRRTLAGYEERAADMSASLGGLERRVDETVSGLRRELEDEIRQTLEGVTRPTLVPVDIERLLLIANDAARLGKDPDVALEALRIADRRLAALDDPVYAETRRLLAEEIAAMTAARRPDIAGMAHTLSALQARIPELRPYLASVSAETRRGDAAGPAEDDAAPPASWWRRLMDDIGTSLRGLVVLRRTGVEDKPLPPPGMQQLAEQNLHLRLEAARIALLARDADAFRSSIGSLGTWLRNWYRADQPAVAATLDQLAGLASAELTPALPDVSSSLAALRAGMRKRGAAPVYGGDMSDDPAAEEIPPEPVPPEDVVDTDTGFDADADAGAGNGAENGAGAP